MNTLLKMHIGVSQFRLTMKDLRIRRTGNWARFGIGQNGELRRVLSLCMFKWASHLVVVATSFIASLLRHLTGSQNFHHPAPGKLSLLCSGDRLHSFQNKCGFRKKKVSSALGLERICITVQSSLRLESKHCGGWKIHTQKQLLAGTMCVETHPRKSLGVDYGVVLSRYAVPIGSRFSLEFPSEYPG